MRANVLLVLGLAAALAGCGRKADPLPPIIEVPETTTDLAVVQEEQRATLSWSFPQLTRAGRQLTDLGRVEVWRMDLPPGQERVGTGPGGEELKRQLMLGRGRLVARLEGGLLEAATRGNRLTFSDVLPTVTPGLAPPTVWYAVRSRRLDGTPSALSNIVALRPAIAPPPVAGLQAEPGADGIELMWEPLPDARYLLERRPHDDPGWRLISPPDLAQPTLVDRTAEQGRTWRYRVRGEIGGAQGPPGPEITVAYHDVYAPPVVEGLICLPEPGAVRLLWSPVPEPGVGYRAFRRVAGRSWEALGDTDATEFVDPAPPAGALTYAVRSFDSVGNQSESAFCEARVGP